MTETKNNDQMPAYSEAVKSGLYAKRSGLVGKYDNVRRYWEDEITRRNLRPHLIQLLNKSQRDLNRLRIMDLGCGSADGFELLAGIRHKLADLEDFEVNVLSESVLGSYKGVDLNEDLLEQARSIYGANPKMVFEQADLSQGLPLAENEQPYDLYFTSYGTFSHFNDDEPLIELLADVARSADKYCVIVCDWLGRYSYEWQTLWTNDLAENRNMDYVVSYIYDEDERDQKREELKPLYLRLMCKIEAEQLVAEASKRAGVEIRPLGYFDRSVFTGRHMDTAEYNPHAQPIRLAVNSLHETNQRTDLNDLMIDYRPKQNFEHLNNHFERLQICWNTLVTYTGGLLAAYDETRGKFMVDTPNIPATYPPILKQMMEGMRRVVDGVGWLNEGLPRENIIEPQLGYGLRSLVASLQEGQGAAHSLCGIFEVDKE